jgi:ABC-type molybdate transport system substrate-binding protein
MAIASYDNLNYLPETFFIAGTQKMFIFTIYGENGGLLDISSGTASWKLCPYGDYETETLSKSGVVYDTNSFSVTLDYEDTADLSGKYIQQLQVVGNNGDTFTPTQGTVLIVQPVNLN